MHFRLRAATLALALVATPWALAQMLAKYGSVLKGPQGLQVLLAPTQDEQNALVQLKGLNNPVDGVVFLADKVVEGERISYRTQIDGRTWTLVRSGPSGYWRGGGSQVTAYVPGVRDGLSLSYDKKASQAIDMAALSKQYQQQKKDGVQDKLARFDRPRREAGEQESLARNDQAATAACGTPVRTQIVWRQFDDAALQRMSVSGYCNAVADAMRQLCESDAKFKAQAASHAQVQCQLGTKLNLKSEDGKTLFTTAEDAANQGDFALQYLRNQ